MKSLLSSLPSVDSLLQHKSLKHIPKGILKPIIKNTLDELRKNILENKIMFIDEQKIIESILDRAGRQNSTMQCVINATGVILQTNLGRSVLSSEIMDEISPFLQRYNTLEYDLQEGKRGERYIHCVNELKELLGCEDALLVNNNAAAVLLVLNTFAKDKEVLISRGELIEIGGSFRIPEVMKSAGCILKEVGATNKTHLSDYESALDSNTAMILKAHKSNFSQIGFTSECDIAELVKLAKKHNLIDYYDLGSGYLGVFDELNQTGEPSIKQILKANPSLLSFSGDKLLGGTQSGIIIGKKHLIKQLKQNHLLRALRVDKFSIITMEATLRAYRQKLWHKIPTLYMLMQTPQELQQKARILQDKIAKLSMLDSKLVELDSLAGGGSLPNVKFKSYGISLRHKNLDIKSFEKSLRLKGVIAYIKKDRILLDVRTLLDNDMQNLAQILKEI